MFHLSEKDLRLRILGCADGPASFNAEMFAGGHLVTSCDPLYQCSTDQIKQRIDATYKNVMEQTYKNMGQFVWDRIRTPEELGRLRMKAMQTFLADYEDGRKSGRYIAAEAPHLPFASTSFDLALSSHFLFL